ncbi:MAG: hypothetical protein MUF31_16525 [Akkermansiaceae bacterium]|jgi:hypothetical protein|nr:hypothetical protein [Akkermansiaceae bacterium]
MISRILLPLLSFLSGLVPVAASAQVATYTEFSFPEGLVLKPGITRITGGITPANDNDRIYFNYSAAGTLTARLTYTHRNANFVTGTTEWPHLQAEMSQGIFLGSDLFLGLGSSATLSSPFYVQGGSNTIRSIWNLPDADDTSDSFRLEIRTPGGLVNPSYTLELEYIPAPDAAETAGGNNSAATATLRDPAFPGRIGGSISSSTDSDWTRFDVPAGKTLRLHFEDRDAAKNAASYFAPGLMTLRSELLNAQGIPLQTAVVSSAVFLETAGPTGQTYFLRVSPQDDYASVWKAAWVLEDSLEPNNSAGTARHLGTLSAGGRLEIPDLTVMDGDYYTFFTTLPAGTPILAAAIPYGQADLDGGSRLQVVSGASAIQEYRDYATFTTGANGTVTLLASGGPHRYRLLVKPRSAYDVWQTEVSNPQFALPPYLAGESDNDGDGLPAALERALGTSPFVAGPRPISAPFAEGTAWRVIVAMPQGGSVADIRVEESTDLSDWTPLGSARGNFGGSTIPAGRTSGAVITISRPGESRNFLRFAADD